MTNDQQNYDPKYTFLYVALNFKLFGYPQQEYHPNLPWL